MDYINRLDNFDGHAVGEVVVEAQQYEETFAILKKFNLDSYVAKAQLIEGLASKAIESFIRDDDATQFLNVIRASEDTVYYHDLIKYLLMVRQKIKEPKMNSELIYAYIKIDTD
ncbi:hypothetical protein Tco_1007921 [Tanacetum coccineum]